MFKVNFCNGCNISIDCPQNNTYRIKVYDNSTIIFDEETTKNLVVVEKPNSTLSYTFKNYKVEIFKDETLLFTEKIDLRNKKVKINFDSGALGDCIAWIPQVSKFQKTHQCKLYVNCYHRDLFEKVYPNLIFSDSEIVDSGDKETLIPGMKSKSCKDFNCYFESCHCYYATYDLGYYSMKPEIRNETLSKIASDSLGLDYEEIVANVYIEQTERKHKKPYVCCAMQSTGQYKYWNNIGGWQFITNYLKSIGYDVIFIDQKDNYGKDGFINSTPYGIINKTGEFPLQERITDILHCDFFIGLGSGLSWLAWSLKKPVIMISGFSNPNTEFKNPYRVINTNVCNSCWNDLTVEPHFSNRWDYCPKNKNYECSSMITPEMVIEKINKCMKDNNLNPNISEDSYQS